MQVQQLQELQALEIAALRSEIEHQAAASSFGEWQDANLAADRAAAAYEIGRLQASPGPSNP